MRQIVCVDFEQPLEVRERPDPIPTAGEVLIDVDHCGVNYVDGLIVTGRYQIKPPRPFTPGYEVAGRITACGAGVTQFVVGDRVAATPGFGGYTDRLAISATRAAKIPAELSSAQAASFAQSYCTALFALRERALLSVGETVLVLGAAGGVGRAAIDVAKALGAHVIAAASSASRLAQCRDAGAEAVINYGVEDLKARAKELAPNGVDVVFDPVGGTLAEPALRALGYLGRYLVIGFAGGDIPRLPTNQVLLRNRAILGVDWGAWASAHPDAQQALLTELLQWSHDGRIQPVEPTVYAFNDASNALADLVNRAVHGKVVLQP